MYFVIADREQRATIKTAWLTLVLIGMNSVVYLCTALVLEKTNVFLTLGFLPIHRRPSALITHMFVHASAMHLLANMSFLWWAGRYVEDVVGKVFYLISYLLSGLCALGMHLVFSANSMLPLVGASGAISGILGMYVVLFPRIPMKLNLQILFWKVKTFQTRTLWAAASWFGYQVLMALLNAVLELPIAFWAHVGGFIGGVGIGFLFVRLGKPAEYRQRCDTHPEPLPSARASPLVPAKSAAVWLAVAIVVIELVVPRLKPNLTLSYLLAPRPVDVGTPLPQPSSTISPERIYAARPLAVWTDEELGCFPYPRWAFSPDGRWLACAGREHVQLWELSTGDLARTLPYGAGRVGRIGFSAEGTLLGMGEQVWAWPIRDGRDIQPSRIACEGCQDANMRVLAPDGSVLALTQEGLPGVQIWRVAQNEPAFSLGEREVERLSLSPDGTRLALRYDVPNASGWGDDTHVEVWNVRQRELERHFVLDYGPSTYDELVFSPDARLLAVVTEIRHRVEMWRIADGQRVYTLEIEDEELGMFGQVAFSPSGELVVTNQRTIKPWSYALQVWRVSDGEPLYRLPVPSRFGDKYELDRVGFSPDGRLLAATVSPYLELGSSTIVLWGIPE